MKDEIKEILQDVIDDIYQCGEYIGQAKKLEKVLDYITNLQEDLEKLSGSHFIIFQENKTLKEESRDLSRMCELYSKSLYNAELTDYKSRNEKAVEYINTHYLNANEPELLNILQGEDNTIFEEIPQFKGTLEQLDNLCNIRGDE